MNYWRRQSKEIRWKNLKMYLWIYPQNLDLINMELIPYQKVEVNFSISKFEIALVDMKRAQVKVNAQIQI